MVQEEPKPEYHVNREELETEIIHVVGLASILRDQLQAAGFGDGYALERARAFVDMMLFGSQDGR